MREVTYQEIMKKKFARQESIKKLEYHAMGHAIHAGKISVGCRICFTGEQGGGVFFGKKCMFNCPMCYYDVNRKEQAEEEMYATLKLELNCYEDENCKPLAISYVSNGETLLYLDKIKKAARIHNEMEKKKGIKIYRHLYTNGVLATENVLHILKEIGVNEIRFHWSASNFSDKVLESMKKAKELDFVVTVEEPSWPPHKEKLLSLLPTLHEIDLDHLNLVEVQLTEFNMPRIEKVYPEGIYYKDYFYHLYDEGLVYDIIEEKIKNDYCFSVLDCNSGVERSRHGKFQHVGFNMEDIKGLTRDFNFE